MASSSRSLAVLFLALAASCVLPGRVRAVKTADQLDELTAAIEELRGNSTAASAALSALVAQKDQDPEAAFQRFEKSVHALERSQREVEGRLERVRAEADEYFLAWKQQAATIEDEDLKESSEERREGLAKAVERIEESAKPAHEALAAYLTYLHDTQKYLSIDLNPASIDAIEGRAKSAGKTAKSVNDEFDDVLAAVKKAAPLFAVPKPAVKHGSAPAPDAQAQN